MRTHLISFFLLISFTFASKILPFNPYGGNLTCNYYYICGCNKVAHDRSINFEDPKVYNKVFRSTYVSCMNAIWPNFTEFVHEASSSLPAFTPVTKGQIIDGFDVPYDGFVHSDSRRFYRSNSYFVFFGPKRTSDVATLQRIGFPSFKEVTKFHRSANVNFYLSQHDAPERSIEDVYFATRDSEDNVEIRKLKEVQIFLSHRNDWQRLVKNKHMPKIQKLFQKHFPGNDVHLISTTDKYRTIRLYFRPFTLVPPGAMIAMKIPSAKFEPIDAWRFPKYSCVIATDAEYGICGYFILLAFDAVTWHDEDGFEPESLL